MERLSFYINKQIHYVVINRTNNRNMYLKVKDFKIIVSAPLKASFIDIQNFVAKHIQKFIDYVETKKKAKLYSLENNYIWLNGIKFKFSRLTGFKKLNLIIKEKIVYMETNLGSDEEVVKLIKKYLKTTLLNYLEVAQQKWEKLMNIPPHSFKATFKTSTWAVNYVTKKTIIYSSRLAHYNFEVIDCVIVHELAHHKIANHSTKFWQLVKTYIPAYKDLRSKLKG